MASCLGQEMMGNFFPPAPSSSSSSSSNMPSWRDSGYSLQDIIRVIKEISINKNNKRDNLPYIYSISHMPRLLKKNSFIQSRKHLTNWHPTSGPSITYTLD
jgi:hypothetical protein